MVVERREALRRVYLRLGLGEIAATLVFFFVALLMVNPLLQAGSDRIALWCALIPLLTILLQAGIYWLLARRWVGIGPMPRTSATVYRAFRALDPALLAAGLLGTLVFFPQDVTVSLLVIAVWGFGVIEYINYFALRLSYPIGHWMSRVRKCRTPQLVKDLNAARS